MIKIYKTNKCSYCRMVGQYLTNRGIEHEFIDITDNFEARVELQNITGATTVPITFRGEKFVIGYNIGKLAELTHGM